MISTVAFKKKVADRRNIVGPNASSSVASVPHSEDFHIPISPTVSLWELEILGLSDSDVISVEQAEAKGRLSLTEKELGLILVSTNNIQNF